MNQITPQTLEKWARILDYCKRGAKVRLAIHDDSENPAAGEIIEGVARHVVNQDNIAFTSIWTDESRLRVTNYFDLFIPLKDIEDILEDS